MRWKGIPSRRNSICKGLDVETVGNLGREAVRIVKQVGLIVKLWQERI